jgi:hypothetical protein
MVLSHDGLLVNGLHHGRSALPCLVERRGWVSIRSPSLANASSAWSGTQVSTHEYLSLALKVECHVKFGSEGRLLTNHKMEPLFAI